MKARQATKIVMRLAEPKKESGKTYYTKSPSALIEFLGNCRNPRILKSRKVFERKFKNGKR